MTAIQSRRSGADGPPENDEKLVLADGTAFPGCARLTCFSDTGWKACATESEFLVFSTRFSLYTVDFSN